MLAVGQAIFTFKEQETQLPPFMNLRWLMSTNFHCSAWYFNGVAASSQYF